MCEAEALLQARRLQKALEAFAEAEAAGEEADRCAGGRWTASMLLGDFEAAWRESDAIRRRGARDPHRFWQGEPLNGRRVMVRCLHGFGDAVQFLRYVPLLRRIAAEVIVEVAPPFVELAGWIEGVDRAIAWGEQGPRDHAAWDVQMEVMELPYIFRTRLQDLPLATRYLRVPEHRLPPIASGASKRLRVGVAWTAGSWNSARSITLEQLAPIFAAKGVEFWSLAAEPDGLEMAGSERRLRTDPCCRSSLGGLAALVSQLHMVVSVDTLAAHVAGAQGVPTCMMVQHAADWRWMQGRTDSPWYPSMRVFRQPQPGDWTAVVRAVGAVLRGMAASAGSG